MNEIPREQRINEAFVKVADTLMDSYDIVDLLSTLVNECTDLLGVDAGGMLIADTFGNLELVASTSEEAEFVEVMQLAAGAGPCVECFTSGAAVSVADIRDTDGVWPEFSAAALQRGFRSLHATPMRLRGRVIGTMNLLGVEPGVFDARDVALAQALADVAIIGILQERSLRDPQIISEQLHLALDTRVMIEQAKGVLSHVHSMSMEGAFRSMRAYARDHGMSLRDVAGGIIDRSITLDPVETESRHRDG
jgi:GAF domain-containing protein